MWLPSQTPWATTHSPGVDGVAKTATGVQTVAGGVMLPEGKYAIYTVAGALVKSGVAKAGDVINLANGLYVVKAAGAAAKVLVK